MARNWTLVLDAVCIVTIAGGGVREADRPAPLAGWVGVFPELPGYQRKFQAPEVARGKAPTEYSQTVVYEWTGNDIRAITVSLVRAPKIEKSPPPTRKETLRTLEEVKVGKWKGWYIEYKQEEKGPNLWIVLATDRTLHFRWHGLLGKEEMLQLLKRFDLQRAQDESARPPRTDFRRKLEDFRALKKSMSYADVVAWAGDADADAGSGIHIMVYKLSDGSRVLVGTPDLQKVLYIKHESKDGRTLDLGK
ncbi:MAG TPA: hypothetical protein VKD72_14555 [Gemmataceae bacterium]|nr:hypothetical protein [Gemmataceae bacterium]